MSDAEPKIERMVPLSRKISAVIFLCIFLAEAILLSFSYFNERDRLLARIDHSIEVLMPSLSPIYIHGQAVRSVNRLFTGYRYPLLGVVLESSDGQRYDSGNVNGIRRPDGSVRSKIHKSESGIAHYSDRHVQLKALASNRPVDLFLRFEVSAVQGELQFYVFKIFLLTIFITLLVVIGTLTALRPFLFKPLKSLGTLMRRVDSTGLAAISIPTNFLLKRDEIGDAFRAFSRMRDALLTADEEKRVITTRFQGFAELAADCFFETDNTGKFSFVAGDTQSVFGFGPAEMIGKTFADLVEEGRLPFSNPTEVAHSLREEGSWEGPLVSKGKDGEVRTVKMMCTTVFDSQGKRTGLRGVLTDTTLATKLTRELTYRAVHDGLTSLYNRTEFSRRVAGSLETLRAKQSGSCVFVLNLDRFKYVNDKYGRLAGDAVLLATADILRTSVRSSDVIARMGGDEFAILLQRCSVENGIEVAENIRSALETMRVDWEGQSVSVGVSIGIVEVDDSFTDVDAVMLAADSSCLIAKRQGHNHVRVYSSGDDAVKERSDDLQWITLIERALKEDRCILYQQPIMSLNAVAPDTVHFEVLLRLLDDNGEIIPPGMFLPCAERNGLIDGIDRQVVVKVLQWLNDQQADATLDLTVSVNLSGASVADPEFQDFLLSSISEAGITARHLCFEITESAAIQNLGSSAEFLARVRALGCRIAIDDFGTGFASLEYIKQLPLDFIKIDGAFIREIVDNPLDQALVRCVSDVAHILDVETIAEFVENDATIRELNAIGIDFAQGYLISKPKPLGDLSTLFPASQERELVH